MQQSISLQKHSINIVNNCVPSLDIKSASLKKFFFNSNYLLKFEVILKIALQGTPVGGGLSPPS